MLNKMVKEKLYCGIDIGARSIKAGILKIRDMSDMKLIGVYEQNTYGFKNNVVSDLDEFSECIHTTIQELNKKTGVKFKGVQVGLGGAMIETRETNTVIPLIDRGSKVISRRDIKKINENARLLGVQMEEEILHDLPQQYSVDDTSSVSNPIGLYGRKLGVRSLMVVVNDNLVRNISKAIHQAGYDVEHIFLNSYTASEVLLNEREKKEGCILVDVGSQYTTILTFRDGVLHSLEGIHLGGDHLTHNIVKQINLPFTLAEEIKKSYAVAGGFDLHEDEEILVKKEDAYIPIKRGIIFEAIKPEVEQLVEYIRTAIINSGLKDQRSGSVTFIGGGALLPGFIDRVGEDLGIPVRLGKMKLSLEKTLSYTALFSSVVGLAQEGYKKNFRYSFSANGKGHWTKSISNRVKDLYQEYF